MPGPWLFDERLNLTLVLHVLETLHAAVIEEKLLFLCLLQYKVRYMKLNLDILHHILSACITRASRSTCTPRKHDNINADNVYRLV